MRAGSHRWGRNAARAGSGGTSVGVVTPSSRRTVHAIVTLVALVAVLWQLALVVTGESVLAETARPGLATRVGRFASYFTILSNLLVLATSAMLARVPDRDGSSWRVVRMAAIVGITITGVVHWFLLRPILDLQGGSYVVDKLLHVVVPVLALVAWFVAGPRGQASRREVLLSLLWPLAWGGWTLVVGALSGWWPYPFIDADDLGWGAVLVNLVGIAVLFAVVGLGFVGADRALGRRRATSAG